MTFSQLTCKIAQLECKKVASMQGMEAGNKKEVNLEDNTAESDNASSRPSLVVSGKQNVCGKMRWR